jgi:hypothetical protein
MSHLDIACVLQVSKYLSLQNKSLTSCPWGGIMRSRSLTFVLTIVAYCICTFGVQGASHFAINADHYAQMGILRAEPIVPMGITSMLIQGTLFALLFPVFNRGGSVIRNALVFSWAIGAFLVSYIALGEAGKYAIPSIGSWLAVEVTAAAVQFSLFGLLLGLLHRSTVEPNAATVRA